VHYIDRINSVLFIAGAYLFLSGFLLTRLVLEDRSQCDLPPVQLSDNYTPGSIDRGCWHPKTFNKAVIVVIDALRYDFTIPYKPSHPDLQQPLAFQNQIPIFYDTAITQPNNAFLLPFIADPPTTTLQRLKGLTTGSLPTFIDAGSNFAGDAIDEDNILTALKKSGKNIIHLGDDTWAKLFPNHFDEELSKSYDSLRTWDLETVDEGVTTHIIPLLHPSNSSRWDVIIGHYLGVDHAGHQYGPSHPAMSVKLQEMNKVMTEIMHKIDDETLFIVMGDHGMDETGNHGGEADLELEAAIWMYSKQPFFGRLMDSPQHPPQTAKERPIRQIDLVPTLSLLLGIPIPFNNLGIPIVEAFIGTSGSDYPNLAKVYRLATSQIRRYLEKYTKVRDLNDQAMTRIDNTWSLAENAWSESQKMDFPPLAIWKSAFHHFSIYQQETLQLCRDLWARFDDFRILQGISILLSQFVLLTLFITLNDGRVEMASMIIRNASIHGLVGAGCGFVLHKIMNTLMLGPVVSCASITCIFSIIRVFYRKRENISFRPISFWTCICIVSILLLCIGFAANSFTIWEDEILLMFLVTFGVLMGLVSFKQKDKMDRYLGVSQSLIFIVSTRLASISRSCRDEQKPWCEESYHVSGSASLFSQSRLLIPFIIAAVLPSIIKSYYHRSRNYHGSGTLWIGMILRFGFLLNAIFWLIEAIDDGDWTASISSTKLKSTRVMIAQFILALSWAAGYSFYIYSSPFVAIEEKPSSNPNESAQSTTSTAVEPNNPNSEIFTTISSPTSSSRPQILIFGYSNTHGTRFFLLLTVWILPVLLLTKPLGQLSLSLLLISILSLVEILDSCSSNPQIQILGPTILCLLSHFYFFKTGHSATLQSIQWNSAFIPSHEISYPLTPIVLLLNTFSAVVLCTISVPLLALWKISPRTSPQKILERLARDYAVFLASFMAIALATTFEANWLRRHLMLYRVFMPRMLLGVCMQGIAFVSAILGGLVGVRISVGSVAGVFGWGE